MLFGDVFKFLVIYSVILIAFAFGESKIKLNVNDLRFGFSKSFFF